MKTLSTIFHIGQIVFAVALLGWSSSMAIRCAICGSPIFIVICFIVMAIVAYKMMLIPSIEEYKQSKNQNKH